MQRDRPLGDSSDDVYTRIMAMALAEEFIRKGWTFVETTEIVNRAYGVTWTVRDVQTMLGRTELH